MFNLASKVLLPFVDQPGLILILLIFAWLIRKRGSKWFHGTIARAVAILLLFASPAPSDWIIQTLELKYPDSEIRDCPTSQAIVVLAGGSEPWQ